MGWVVYNDQLIKICVFFVILLTILVVIDCIYDIYYDRQDVKDIKEFFYNLNLDDLINFVLEFCNFDSYINRNEFIKDKKDEIIARVYYLMMQNKEFQGIKFSLVKNILKKELESNSLYWKIDIILIDYYDNHQK